MKIEVLTIITAKKYRVQKQRYNFLAWMPLTVDLLVHPVEYYQILFPVGISGLISPVPNSAGVWIAESIHRYVILKARIVLNVCLRNRFKTFHKQNYNTSTHLGLAEGHVLFVPFEK